MTIERGASLEIKLSDPSGAGEVRRAVVSLAARLGFGEVEREQAAIVATEIATNVVKHGGGGRVLVRRLGDDGRPGIEVVAVDAGPGISDLARATADGFSTSGSPGTGLGAGARLSASFEIYSTRGAGTTVCARLGAAAPKGARVGVVCVPKPGEVVCGDEWGVVRAGATATLMVADGLGHGPLAADASRAAVAVLAENAGRSPVEILEAAHAALRPTRGAAVAVAAVDFAARSIRYAGVGNVAGAIAGAGEAKQMVSHNGTVGHDARRIQEFVYPIPPGGRVVMHSDGIGTQWRLDKYPGLWLRDPSLVAGVLYRDFCRGRDDATVVVLAEEAVA